MSIQTDRASGGGSPAEALGRPPHGNTATYTESNRRAVAGQLSADALDCIDTFRRLDAPERGTVLRGLLAANLAAVEADLAPKQAAAAAGVAPSTVRGWCVAGLLGRRVGGRWRVTASEVRALVAGGRS